MAYEKDDYGFYGKGLDTGVLPAGHGGARTECAPVSVPVPQRRKQPSLHQTDESGQISSGSCSIRCDTACMISWFIALTCALLSPGETVQLTAAAVIAVALDFPGHEGLSTLSSGFSKLLRTSCPADSMFSLFSFVAIPGGNGAYQYPSVTFFSGVSGHHGIQIVHADMPDRVLCTSALPPVSGLRGISICA